MEVVAHAIIVGVSVYLGLPLYLFFCLLHGSYAAPLGVLQVLRLLGGCLAF